MLLSPEELVKRWGGAVTTRTLANWRAEDKGPRFMKIGRAVRYRLDEVEKWEKSNG